MKRTVVILLIMIICLSFCLTSCNKNDEYRVLIDEKDITIDGKNTINLEDLYSWFDFINEKSCRKRDENKFYITSIRTQILLCENSIEAQRYYKQELVLGPESFNKIILRINNIVIFNDNYTARRSEFIEFLNFFDIDIEKSERILEREYLIEEIENYDEEKVLNYFMNNEQYDCFMAKYGDSGIEYNLDGVEYGYVITDINKKSYLVLNHFMTLEELENMPDSDDYTASIVQILFERQHMRRGEFLPILRIYGARFSYSMSYNLYDDSNIIWSDDMEWIELVKSILSSEE